MSKSKPLALPAPDPMARHILHLRAFHQSSLMAGFQSIAAAIFTGLELLATQADLKKCNSCTFEDWMEKHECELGFSRRTAFHYTKLAKGMKARVGDVEPLLSFAPSDLKPEQQKRLLKAVHKSVDGETLNELYQDFGIIKKKHGHGLLKAHDKSAKLALPDSAPPSAEQLFFDEIFLPLVGGGDGTVKTIWQQFDDVIASWNKKVKLGNTKLPLWQHGARAKKQQVLREARAKRAVVNAKLDDLIAQLEEALGQ